MPDQLTPYAGVPTIVPRTGRPRSRRRPVGVPRRLRLGPVLVVQAVAVLALGLATAGVSPPLVAAVAGAGVVLAGVRIRGRWGADWLRVWLRYRMRRRRTAVGPLPAPVMTHVDRSGATFGVMARESALDMVLAVDAAPPLRLLVDALDDRGVRLASARLLVGHRRRPPARMVQVVLRLRPADCPAAVLARGGGVEGARRALSAAATRLVRTLADHGVAARVLTPAEVAAQARGTAPREFWDHYAVDDTRHVGYALTRWPTDVTAFLAGLPTLPGDEAVAAVVIRPGERGPRLRGVLRLVGSDLTAEMDRAAGTAAQRLGARLVRLDGEHGWALTSTSVGGVG